MRSPLALGLVAMMLASAAPGIAGAQELRSYLVVRDSIPHSLTGEAGDAGRGRAIVANRTVGLCLLCHSAPLADERFQGTLAPSLAGSGSRWSEGQLRLRLVDPARFNRDTIMPSYYRLDGLRRVAKNFTDKTILSDTQIEDVLAYLVTLQE